MTVILDCNIWISLTINSQIDFIADLSDNGIIIASCDTLKHEITSVLNRPKLAKFILPTDIDKITELHDLVATQYSPGKIKPVTKDPKDDYLFALATKCNADYLVTGDKLLQDVDRYKKTRVITLAQFKELLK